MTTQTDTELSALIGELIAADLLKTGTREHRLAVKVAMKGLTSLEPADRIHYEQFVLPILAKPIREQIAVAAIVRKGGYVPRKITF